MPYDNPHEIRLDAYGHPDVEYYLAQARHIRAAYLKGQVQRLREWRRSTFEDRSKTPKTASFCK